MRRIGLSAAALTLVMLLSLHGLAPAARAATPEYTLTDLGSLGGRLYSPFAPGVGTAGQASDMNNAGQVVGYSYLANNESSHPFLYHNGVMSRVDVTGGTNSNAFGINDLGHIIGRLRTPAGDTRNYVLANGVTTLLPRKSWS